MKFIHYLWLTKHIVYIYKHNIYLGSNIELLFTFHIEEVKENVNEKPWTFNYTLSVK